ncbi:group III truncated hemoglobin [Pseudonocardia sp. H11422]|uniref:group III truncated hemoglobin n=1 Tax=Pseudonocardia sp. H11422 TaxID=2835866 RepID=UPI001BDC8A0A|nr:group III truncated hemoglobin [Pseudonocardia sp. H11422]
MTGADRRRDIADRDDITALVTAFYRRAFADDVLGPIFVDIARMDLPVHLPVMCDFWETVLLHAGRYRRNALRPHLALNAKVELTEVHFARWLDLWTATVDERHRGDVTELAKVQAARIAGSIARRLRGNRLASPSPSRVGQQIKGSHDRHPAPGADHLAPGSGTSLIPGIGG